MININLICNDENDKKIITALIREQEDFKITGVGKDGFDAIRLASQTQPDVIIMDFLLGDVDCPQLTPIIKRKAPSVRMISLISKNECGCVDQFLKMGISGCYYRQEGFDNLPSSIKSVYYGGLYVSLPVREHALRCFAIPDKAVFPEEFCHLGKHFSATELHILNGITLGQTDREIAKNLNMSTGSLRNCINHSKQKTGLKNRTQMSVYAIFAGMINPRKISDQFKEA